MLPRRPPAQATRARLRLRPLPPGATRALLRGAVLGLLLAACSSTTQVGPPSPTPADFIGIADLLAENGIRVEGVVSGDAGCDDPDLVPTAIAFTAQGKDQASPVPVRLYIFRNSKSYDRLRPAVDACAATWLDDPDGYEALDADPFVLTGQGPWPTAFQEALRTALTEAAGG